MSICLAIGDTVSLAVSDTLALGLVVGLNVEVDEEAEVAGEENTSKDSSDLSSSASAKVRQPGEVVGGIVVVCCIRMSDFAILRVFAGLATY